MVNKRQQTIEPQRGSRRGIPERAVRSDLRFTTRNYGALGAALVCIVIGYLLLHRGDITAAPILLVLGYCVLIPYGLAAGHRVGEPSTASKGE